MDYILFGFGTGATLALGGWLFRDLGPRIRDRSPGDGDVLSAREMVSRMAWARFCASCGAALALAGIILMLVTIGTAFWNPPDDQGFEVILIAYAVIVVLMLIWTGLFLRLFGSIGIIRPREAKPALAKPEPEKATASGDQLEAEDATESPSERSFAEVAAARGGLGRFADFFRRDTASDDADVDGTDDQQLIGPPVVDHDDDDESEFGDFDYEEVEAKRLAADDPLVTEVLGEIAEDRVVEPDLEASLISELSMPSGNGDAVVDDYDDAEVDPSTASEETHPEMSPEDQAVDLLRKKRLARLSGYTDE